LALDPSPKGLGRLLCPHGVQAEKAEQVTLQGAKRANRIRLDRKRIRDLAEKFIAVVKALL